MYNCGLLKAGGSSAGCSQAYYRLHAHEDKYQLPCVNYAFHA